MASGDGTSSLLKVELAKKPEKAIEAKRSGKGAAIQTHIDRLEMGPKNGTPNEDEEIFWLNDDLGKSLKRAIAAKELGEAAVIQARIGGLDEDTESGAPGGDGEGSPPKDELGEQIKGLNSAKTSGGRSRQIILSPGRR